MGGIVKGSSKDTDSFVSRKHTFIEHDLNELLSDAAACEYSSYVDDNGMTFIKIECMVNEEEKERVWDVIRFKHRKDCNISSEPKAFYE